MSIAWGYGGSAMSSKFQVVLSWGGDGSGEAGQRVLWVQGSSEDAVARAVGGDTVQKKGFGWVNADGLHVTVHRDYRGVRKG